MSSAAAVIGLGLVGVAGALHIVFFLLETVLWDRVGRRTFGVPREDSTAVRGWAFNQGWYNLFLGIGAIASSGVGIVSVASAGSTGGLGDTGGVSDVAAAGIGALSIAVFTALCMVGASAVLLVSNRRMLRGALVQGLVPLLGLVILGVAAVV